VSSTKARGRPLKSTPAIGRAIKQGDQKDTGSLTSAKIKSTDSPSSSEEASSPEYDSSSDEESDEEEMLEKISDVSLIEIRTPQFKPFGSHCVYYVD
jgi:hypothetical protein